MKLTKYLRTGVNLRKCLVLCMHSTTICLQFFSGLEEFRRIYRLVEEQYLHVWVPVCMSLLTGKFTAQNVLWCGLWSDKVASYHTLLSSHTYLTDKKKKKKIHLHTLCIYSDEFIHIFHLQHHPLNLSLNLQALKEFWTFHWKIFYK